MSEKKVEKPKLLKEPSGIEYFELAGIKVQLDRDSIVNFLNQLDKLNTGAWTTLATNFGVPCEPFDKSILKPVLLSFLQLFWYETVKGKVPDKVTVGHASRMEKYAAELEDLKKNPDRVKKASTRSGAAKESKPRVSKTYRLVEGQREVWSKFGGQKALIITAMLNADAVTSAKVVVGLSVNDLAAVIKDKLETKQPPERVVAFYMNDFGHKGLVEEVTSTSLATTPPAKAEDPPAQAAPVEEPPKAEGKKHDKKK